MTAPNPLVAERQDSTTAISGIGIAESAVDVYNGISSGSWVEGGLGLAGAGLETLGLVIDPVGTLVSYGVAWLMEHVKPLSDALDWLAGDPDTIASYAQTWRNVSQAVGQARTDFDGAVRTDTAAWTGAAGDAYRAHAAQQSEHIGAASTAAETVGTVVEVVGVLVGVVREIVRDLVADCVATLIARIPQWLAEIAATLGIATPHVIASAVALIAKWVARISDVIRKLVRSIEKLRPLLRRLDEIWEAVRSGVRGLGDAARRGPNGSGPSSFAPESVRNPASVDSPTVSTDTPGTPGSTTSGTPGTVSDTPTVSPDTPGTTPGGTTGTTPSGVSPTPTVSTDTPGTTSGGTPAATPGSAAPSPTVAPGAPSPTPGGTPAPTPSSATPSPTVAPDAPASTTAQGATPGSVATTPASTAPTGTTPGGVSPGTTAAPTTGGPSGTPSPAAVTPHVGGGGAGTPPGGPPPASSTPSGGGPINHYDSAGNAIPTSQLPHPDAHLLDQSLIDNAANNPNRGADALRPGIDANHPTVQSIVPGSYRPEGFDPTGRPLSQAEWEQRYWSSGSYDARGNRDLDWPDPQQHPDGFASPTDRRPVVLQPGDVIDRFGPGFGRYASPPGTPFPERGLPPDNLYDMRNPVGTGVTPGAPQPSYHQYQVVRPLPVWEGPIAPAMGQPGGGVQYVTPTAIVDLVNAGYLVEITP